MNKLGRNKKLFGQEMLLWKPQCSQAAFKGSAALPDFLSLTFFQVFYLRKIKKSFYYWDLKYDNDNILCSPLRSMLITCPMNYFIA